ncbi:MAG TPA: type II secretion system F family protein [Elusimicrobiales bacterium]|nr:type II secretion system F family protein [Elusimicrobiales bacterium]
MISDELLLDLCRALATTVRSGLTLSEAFETLAKSSRHGAVMARAAALTSGGAALHEAFAAQGIFPAVFLALLRAGEEGGKADEFLELYADCLEVRVKFRKKIERMLVYPLFVILLAGVLFLLVSFKVVPVILEPLLKSGAALPPHALFFNALAESLYRSWYKLLGGAALAGLALRWLLRSGPGRKARGLAGHWLPPCRFAVAEARLYYLYTTIGLLLKAGLLPGAMMEILLQFSQDDLITRRRLLRASGLMANGGGFAESAADLMQEDDRHALEIAEKSGRLAETFLNRAKLHYERHLHRLKLLVTAFNITTLVAIALVCFGLVLTAVWPAISVLSGGGDALRGLGLTAPAAPPPPAQPAGGAPPETAPSLTPQEIRTRSFNRKHGGEIMDLMQRYGKAPAPAADGGAAQEKPKPAPKLAPVAPMKTIQFNRAAPTDIQPTKIKGR